MRAFLSKPLLLLLQLVPMVGMLVLLFTRPAMFEAVVEAMLALGLGLSLLIGGIVLWGMLAPASLARLGFRVTPASSLGHVGREGHGSRLRIIDAPGKPLRVEWSRGNYLFLFLVLALFGPGLAAVATFQHERLSGLPVLVLVSAAAMVLLACVLVTASLYDWLWRRPALEVTLAGIALKAGGATVRSIARETVDGVWIEPHTYTHDRVGTPNWILTVRLADRSNVRLCISDRKEQIERLASLLRSRMSLGPDRL